MPDIFLELLMVASLVLTITGAGLTVLIITDPRKDIQRRDALKWTIPLAVCGLCVLVLLFFLWP